QDRRAVRARVARDGARRRLSLAPGGADVNRLSIRLRVTIAFALAMAVVLAVSGLYVYARLSSHLTVTLDRELRVRADDLVTLVPQPHFSLAQDQTGRFIEHGETYVQLLTPHGRVIDATRPLGRAPLLTAAELRRAASHPLYLDEPSVPG